MVVVVVVVVLSSLCVFFSSPSVFLCGPACLWWNMQGWWESDDDLGMCSLWIVTLSELSQIMM